MLFFGSCRHLVTNLFEKNVTEQTESELEHQKTESLSEFMSRELVVVAAVVEVVVVVDAVVVVVVVAVVVVVVVAVVVVVVVAVVFVVSALMQLLSSLMLLLLLLLLLKIFLRCRSADDRTLKQTSGFEAFSGFFPETASTPIPK